MLCAIACTPLARRAHVQPIHNGSKSIQRSDRCNCCGLHTSVDLSVCGLRRMQQQTLNMNITAIRIAIVRQRQQCATRTKQTSLFRVRQPENDMRRRSSGHRRCLHVIQQNICLKCQPLITRLPPKTIRSEFSN